MGRKQKDAKSSWIKGYCGSRGECTRVTGTIFLWEEADKVALNESQVVTSPTHITKLSIGPKHIKKMRYMSMTLQVEGEKMLISGIFG